MIFRTGTNPYELTLIDKGYSDSSSMLQKPNVVAFKSSYSFLSLAATFSCDLSSGSTSNMILYMVN